MKTIKRKKILITIAIILGILFVVYCALIYFLVSATLVPSFMEKLDAFEEISDKSYSEMVWTDDISVNRKEAIEATREWLKDVKYELPTIESSDGYKFVGTIFLQGEESSKWALLLHGYTGWKEEMYQYAYWYYQNGYNILVPDLRCSGSSEGDFIGMGWTDHFDCMEWLKLIIERDSDAQIVLHGQSMGAATALIMTGDEQLPDNVVACVSDCAYTTAYEMFGQKCREWFHLPAFPFVDSAVLMLRMRGGYNLRDASAIDAVKKSSIPTLFIHGIDDAFIDVSMTQELYEAEAADKDILLVDGAGHAQSADKDPDGYYSAIDSFIRKYVR